jgi:hypothetical protein
VFLVTFSSSSGYSFANCHPMTHVTRRASENGVGAPSLVARW